VNRGPRAVLVAVAVLAGSGAVGALATGGIGGASADHRPAAAQRPATAKVERVNLVRSQTVPGTLGYGTATSVEHPASNGGIPGGRLTWLPAPGATVERGKPVYVVDEHPVPLLYGATPLYRDLSPGMDGQDVRVVEDNLTALGYTGFTVDDHYTSGTADAVRRWQRDLGIPDTGTLGPGQAVVAPGPRRVAAVTAVPGRTAAGPVLTWTGTERSIAVDLDVQYEDLVQSGTKATVELPDGTSVDAQVTEIGTAASAPTGTGTGTNGGGSGAPAGGASGPPQAGLPVTLAVPQQDKLGRFQAAPVNVTVVAETRPDVLAVPVNALVALREGGYAIEVAGTPPPGAPADYRPVTLGMFVNGRVEVSGPGITEGLTVVVPQ
jgi:peptidoglycan hydrolase-like protein with peptidoglycan-binding domain